MILLVAIAAIVFLPMYKSMENIKGETLHEISDVCFANNDVEKINIGISRITVVCRNGAIFEVKK